MRVLLLVLMTAGMIGCASTSTNYGDHYEKYRVHKGTTLSVFEGEYRNQYASGRHSHKWIINGTGRAITARIIINGMVAHSAVFSYSSSLKEQNKINHRKQMIRAFDWVFGM